HCGPSPRQGRSAATAPVCSRRCTFPFRRGRSSGGEVSALASVRSAWIEFASSRQPGPRFDFCVSVPSGVADMRDLRIWRLVIPCLYGMLATAHGQERDALREQAAAAMKQAALYYRTQVASHGGYVYHYSEDLSVRFGEGPAGP